jgi:fucose-1-phosphate guanylyltransferase
MKINSHFQFYNHLINSFSLNDDYFNQLLSTETIKLWDLVVISAISESQKKCYERQIQMKLDAKAIPSQFTYLVISDPQDCKVGSGGSTMHIISKLNHKFGGEIFGMKILLIHAGGYSQRMPSSSVLGKIFHPIPCESPLINDMFDMKLAFLTPFSIHMKPGIFISPSDDFESFIFEEQVSYSKLFSDENDNLSFVLPAHKSSLKIATEHGVYALNEKKKYFFLISIYY